MTTKKNEPGTGPERPAETPAPKKPYATLDLTATEIKPDVGTEAKAAAAAAPASSASTLGQSDTKPTAVKQATAATSSVPNAGKPAAAAPASTDKKADTQAKPSASPSATAASPGKPAAATAPPARSGSGIGSFLTHTTAGLVGGFLALIGADTVAPQLREIAPQLGLPVATSPSDAVSADLARRIAALETRPAAAATDEASLAKTIASLDSRVSDIAAAQQALAAKAEALAKQASAASAADAPAERLARLEQQLATIAAAAGADGREGGSVPQIAAITGRLADLESALANQVAALRTSVGKDIETRLASVGEASEAARSGTQRVDKELAAVTTEAARLGQRVEKLSADTTRVVETLRVVQEETGTVRSSLDALKGDVEAKLTKVARPADIASAVAPIGERIAGLEAEVKGVVAAEQDRKANAQRIVLSLELANLKRAIERGTGFATELAEVRKAAAGLVDVAPLTAYETGGVANLAALEASFAGIAHKIIDAAAAPAESGVIDQLLAGARSVVRVRRVDHDAADTSVEAIVGRMEKALRDGRLGDVIAEAGKLPPSAAAPAKEWLGKVAARQSVDGALAAIEGQLKTSLGSSG
ncbi:MAG: hypothetical protein NW205_11860 [Hyphomicrobiaceae bacterium]|nr:hypothetical protein [Hyphomicrobiaceae bacterium]